MRPKSKKDTGLGKAIIRDRFKGNTRPKDGDTFLVFIINNINSYFKLTDIKFKVLYQLKIAYHRFG